MRVLITGICGLIGSEIAQQLSAQGHTIIGNDDLSHNCREPRELPIERMFTCRVEQLEMFVTGLTPLPSLIIHCASPVGHARLTPQAQTAWRIVSDTQAVLELAERTGACLITFSSSEVLTYKGETDIRAQYALGKLAGEAMVLGHPRVDGRVLRPYNVTGRHQRADGGFVMARFREQALAGQPLTVFGTGKQIRHFLHVSDFARFVCLLVEKWPERKCWSVMNPWNSASVGCLASMFSDKVVLGCSGAGCLGNPDWRDSPDRLLDIAAYDVCVALGWQPRITLEQIVREHLTGELTEASA